MKIRMVVACDLQEAGRERPLSIGGEYDLADGVASALISDGRAELVVETEAEAKDLHAPETKPALVPERRRR